MSDSYLSFGSPTPDDMQRIAFYEAAVQIGAHEGEEHITLERVAAKAGMPVHAVQAMFESDEALVSTIGDYLKERKARYIVMATSAASAQGVSAMQRLISLADGYFAYFEEEPELYHYVFERYGGLTDEELALAREGKKSGNQSLDILMGAITDFALECGAEIGVTTSYSCIAGQAVNVWSTVHGMGHLSLQGVLRHQHKVVRRYTFSTVLHTTLGAVADFFAKDGQIRVPDSYDKLLELAMSQAESRLDYTDIDFNTNDDDELLRKAVFEAAIDIVGEEGSEALELSKVAQRLGVTEARVARAAENEFVLRETLETGTDQEIAAGVRALIDSLPEGNTAVDRLRVFGVGYFLYAVSDPTRYNALIMMASGSVVPSGESVQHEEMSASYRVYTELACEAMKEAGIELTDYQVYIRSIIAWAGASGIAHLTALGDLKYVSFETKWRLFRQVSEVVIATFSIDLPEQSPALGG